MDHLTEVDRIRAVVVVEDLLLTIIDVLGEMLMAMRSLKTPTNLIITLVTLLKIL